MGTCTECGAPAPDVRLNGELCATCFWRQRNPAVLWPLRANGVAPETLAILQEFAYTAITLVHAQQREAAELGLADSPALYASALQAQLAELRTHWRFAWVEHAETLLEALLDRALGRTLPDSVEDFARELTLVFYQAIP